VGSRRRSRSPMTTSAGPAHLDDDAEARGPDTYRAAIPTARESPMVTWVMSWQTPSPRSHASQAVADTVVAPGT
jgi:hypothetical protein